MVQFGNFGNFGNIAAGIGSSWNSRTEGHADISISASVDHADFDDMMNAQFLNGMTPRRLLNHYP